MERIYIFSTLEKRSRVGLVNKKEEMRLLDSVRDEKENSSTTDATKNL